MKYLGSAARTVRNRLGKSQQQLADLLDISVVHLSNIENNKSMPSPALLEKYRELSGIDLYVVSWCNDGDVSALPEPVQAAATKLREAWSAHLATRSN